MSGYAARHQIERRVRVWQFLCCMLIRRDLEATRGGTLTHSFQHGRGDIRKRDIMAERREAQARMTSSRRDIQNAAGGGQRKVRERRPNIIHIFKDVALPIMATLPRELRARCFLDFVELPHAITDQ